MPRIDLTGRPYSYLLTYYQNGVLMGNNTQTGLGTPTTYPFRSLPPTKAGLVELSLDPNGSPILFDYKSDTAGYITNPPVSSIYLYAWNWGAGLFYPIPAGTSIYIFGSTFVASDNPGPGEFFAINNDTPQEQYMFTNSLADLINSDPNLNGIMSAIATNIGNIPVVFVNTYYTGTAFIFYTPAEQPNTFTFDVSDPTLLTSIAFNRIFSFDTSRGERWQRFNYGCYLEVWTTVNNFQLGRRASNTTPLKLIASLTSDWTNGNQFQFDVSSYLRNLVKQPTILYPTNTIPNRVFTTEVDAIFPYFVRWGEYFTGGINNVTLDPNDPDNNIKRKYVINQSDWRWTTLASLQSSINPPTFDVKWLKYYYEEQNIIIDINTNIRRLIGQNENGINPYIHPCLTNAPRYKLRRRLQEPEYVYFIVHNDHAPEDNSTDLGQVTYGLKWQYRYIDGTTSAVFTSYSNNDIILSQYSGMLRADVSLFNLELDAHETLVNNRVADIDMWIVRKPYNGIDASFVDYSVHFSYEIDLNCQPEREYDKIYFLNQYGVWDSFEFEFKSIEKINTSRISNGGTLQYGTINPMATMYNQNSDYNKNASNQYYNKDNIVNLIEEYTIESGWVNREHYEWLKELCASPALMRIEEWDRENQRVTFGNRNLLAGIRKEYQSLSVKATEWQIDEQNDLYNLRLIYNKSIPYNNIKSNV